MKLNMELVRAILADIEATRHDAGDLKMYELPGWAQDVVDYHVTLLIEKRLVEGKELRGSGERIGVLVHRLTWEGHEFLEKARNDTVWRRAFAALKEKGLEGSLDLLKTALTAEATKLLASGS
jgi:hypothetical protein